MIESLKLVTQNHEFVNIISSLMKEGNKMLLRSIVDELGIEQSLNYFKETCLIQDNGGMKNADQTRFRTFGGVFFFLVKRSKEIKSSVRKRIFKNESNYWKAESNLIDDLESLTF